LKIAAERDAKPPVEPCNAMNKSIARAGCVSSATSFSLVLSFCGKKKVHLKNFYKK